MIDYSTVQNVNQRLNQSHIRERLRRLEEGRGVDWSTAEALAIGTLLHQGAPPVGSSCEGIT